MRIAVLGAGSIGCLIAAKLVRDGHDVLVHARGEHGATLAIRGLKITGAWDVQIKGAIHGAHKDMILAGVLQAPPVPK